MPALPWPAIIASTAVYCGLLTGFFAPLLFIYLAVMILMRVLISTVISLLVLDFGAMLAEVERSLFWLVAGIVAYVGVTVIWLAAFDLAAFLLVPGLWLDSLVFLAIPVTGAIAWWTYLPDDSRTGVARTFE